MWTWRRGPAAQERASGWPAALALFAGAFILGLLFYSRHPLLYDADSYYHLTIARAFAQDGLLHGLPWARFSVMHQGFGDKELLFHVLLAPFAAMADPLAGGRLALALLDALVLASLGYLAFRAVGPWGLLVPFGLVAGSGELAWRLVRLRPELLSLVILLAALWAMVRGRYRWLGVLAAVYTLSYTAFHAFVGLCVLVFLFLGWARRRWEPGLVLYPVLGAGLGLLVHPQFPKNIEVWVAQSVDFFVHHGALDVGTETRPNPTDAVVLMNLGWFLGLALLWFSARPAAAATEGEARAADVFGVAAVVFGGLYLLMSRFSVYFFPFATLWVLFELRRRGRLPGRWVELGSRRLPAALAAALFVLVCLRGGVRELRTFAARTNPGPREIRLRDREAVARALPPGARVAAPWRSTPIYMFSAPWARFLNVLDPVFMAVPYPGPYKLQSSLFDGSEPDPALAAAGLDSQFIVVPLGDETRRLTERLSGDPRIQALYRGFNGVFRVGPAAGAGFVLDWKVVPSSSPLPPPADAVPASWPDYPRLADPAARATEGYVDARRVAQGRDCVGLVHEETAAAAVRIDYELAPSGPSTLWLDGRLLAATAGEPGAVLGRGIVLPVDLTPGPHRIAVLTCPESTPESRAGFYLLERKRTARP
jgi:hypothetical protein